MDELNKQQIVLLTLLVSFVTSIATGITTVSLVTQAETPTVTQTINRVVEKTIERVTPEEQKPNPITVVKTPEKEVVTVVVKEEDLTVDSVSTNTESIVRIYELAGSQRFFKGLGVVVSDNGSIIANENFFSKYRSYVGVYSTGEYELEAIYQHANDPAIVMKPIVPEGVTATFNQVTFGDVKTLQLGQSVIALGGEQNNRVSSGIINLIETRGEGEEEYVYALYTSVEGPTTLGTILINLKGEVVGMNFGAFGDTRIFTPTPILRSYVNKALSSA